MQENIPKEKLISFFKILKTIYAVKENIRLLSISGDIKGLKGICYGEEAVCTGVCSVLAKNDVIMNTCDGISNLIARGGNINYIISEILGKSEGYNNGVRGLLNISVPEINIYSANSMSDTQVAMGTGFALVSKIKDEKKVIVDFYSSATANEGVIHETMNIASIFNLPVLFVCLARIDPEDKKDNDSDLQGQFSMRSIGYDLNGYQINRTDLSSIYLLAEKIINEIRENSQPAVMECRYKYYYDNFMENDVMQDDDKESTGRKLIKSLGLNDFKESLLSSKILQRDEINKIEAEINILVANAIEFGRNSKLLEYKALKSSMYAEKYIDVPDMGWQS